MEPYSIFLLEEKDAADIASLEAVSFSTPWTEAQYREILRRGRLDASRGGSGRSLGAVPVFGMRDAGGGLAAYLCLGVHHAIGELEVYNIAVRADCKRQGLGRRLLELALRAARRCGIARATLEVRVGNLTAVALYTGLGFTVCGRRKGYYADTGEDALIMECDLQSRFDG